MLKFEDIIRANQKELKHKLKKELRNLGYKTQSASGYIYAEGEIPVLLIAHLDTVHKEPVKIVCYSQDNKIMSPEGIGGDDRCGVYMILEIIKDLKCHVLFCEDEEIGGIGAKKFCKSEIEPKVNYIIELDRKGSNDAVFYDCDNPDFTKFITSFDFKEDFGSFSDISIIAPHLKIAAVNISCGYYHAHSLHEYIDMNIVEKNIEKVKKIISSESENNTYYEYIEAKYNSSIFDISSYSSSYFRASAYDDMYSEEYLMELNDETNMIMFRSGSIVKADGYYVGINGKVYKPNNWGTFNEVAGAMAFSEEGDDVKFSIMKATYELVEL